jgi:hypothetical protein
VSRLAWDGLLGELIGQNICRLPAAALNQQSSGHVDVVIGFIVIDAPLVAKMHTSKTSTFARR